MRVFAACFAWVLISRAVWAAEPEQAGEPLKIERPKANSAEEPVAKEFSRGKGAEFLDAASLTWTRERKCGTCHTNYPHLMASSAIPECRPEARREVRAFFEGRIRDWDQTDKPRGETELVATAFALAFDDAQTTKTLHPMTRKALDKMWELQNSSSGAWNWEKCNWPPLEHDDFLGATYAALAVGYAPENYAASDGAQEGLKRLRRFFWANRPPDLHHKGMFLWASRKLDGLMNAEEQAAIVKELFAAQRPDGGWSLPMLGGWKRRDGTVNDAAGLSDGYATGLVTYVLRQSGVPANDERLQRAVVWLKANQRQSGRWFTRSLNTDRAHYMSHVGSAYALMAIQACAE